MPPEQEASSAVAEPQVNDTATSAEPQFDAPAGAEPDLDRWFAQPETKAPEAAQPDAEPAAVASEPAADESAESPNTESADAAPPSGGLDDETRQWAEAVGLTAEEIGAFQQPEQLRTVLAYLDRKSLAEARAYDEYLAEQARLLSEGQQAQQTQAVAPPAVAAQAAGPLAFEKFKVEVDPNEFDEQSLKLINGINDHYHGAYDKLSQALAAEQAGRQALAQQIEQLTALASDLTQWRQAEVDRRFNAEVDQFFESLEPAYHGEYGAGSGMNLSENSKELGTRRALVQEAMLLQRLERERGQRDSGLHANLKRALLIRHADKHKEQARQEVAQEVGRRKAQAVARPTQRQSTALNPEAKAKETIRKFLYQHGKQGPQQPDELKRWFGE